MQKHFDSANTKLRIGAVLLQSSSNKSMFTINDGKINCTQKTMQTPLFIIKNEYCEKQYVLIIKNVCIVFFVSLILFANRNDKNCVFIISPIVKPIHTFCKIRTKNTHHCEILNQHTLRNLPNTIPFATNENAYETFSFIKMQTYQLMKTLNHTHEKRKHRCFHSRQCIYSFSFLFFILSSFLRLFSLLF